MRTEAQKKADKKYKESGKDKYKTIGAVMHIDNFNKIKELASESGLSASKYATRAILYCADNNIDLSQYREKLRDPDDPKNGK